MIELSCYKRRNLVERVHENVFENNYEIQSKKFRTSGQMHIYYIHI